MTTTETPFFARKSFGGIVLLLGAAAIAAWAQSGSAKNTQQDFLKAVESVKAERWAEASSGFKQVLKEDPENLKAHFYMGEIEYYTRHFSQAEGYFRWVNFHDPHMPVNHYYLGRVDYDQKRYDAALSEMEAALRLDSQISMVHYYLGLIHYKKGDLPETKKELESAIELDPASSKAHYALAYLLYHDLRQSSAAMAETDAALKGVMDGPLREKTLKLKKLIKSGKRT